MKLALAQINTTVGDFDGNLERILSAAKGLDADLVVFPELSLCGYMPRDLLDERAFLARCAASLETLRARTDLPPLLVGGPVEHDGELFNAALFVHGGRVETLFKGLLPNYDVFDERRWFTGTESVASIEIGSRKVGVTICEDAWASPAHDRDPVAELAAAGADVVVNLSASPFEQGKPDRRIELLAGHARRNKVPMALCNLVGGNDQLLFDGNSFAVNANGRVSAHAAAFREEVLVIDFDADHDADTGPREDREDLIAATTLGIADYFRKTGFDTAYLGMSGGVDSSLVACLAARALGPERVTGVSMPGPFNAPESLDDARALAAALGIAFQVLPIDRPFAVVREELAAVWGDRPFDLAEENLQARLRGLYLMALANKENSLVLVPSNKSELAMGYCTLYGDMVGAIAPISDLYKGQVYELARRFDEIPPNVLQRPPSAELRPDQKDEDTLPPYELLDRILSLHIEQRVPSAEIVKKTGADAAVVERVLTAVARTEYKRQQGAPVLKLSAKAFGIGRRFPIVERYQGGV
ncbi:MAG: NAD+ synthase [Planctomycetota bacterium]